MTHHLKHVFTQGTLWLCLLFAAAWAPLAQADSAAEWRRIAQDIKDKALYEGTPQDMYLRAGNFSRKGETHQAEKIYRHLVERHSNTPFAVKASDQLDAMSRNKAMRDAELSAASRESCMREQAQCAAQCRSSGMTYSQAEYCVSARCYSFTCQ